jgi:hypothetical protein
VGLIGDDEVEVGGGEEPLVFVVEEKRLDRRDNDLGTPPIVATLLVDDGLVVVGEGLAKGLESLILQLEAVDEKEDSTGIAGPKEELDEGCGDKRLAGAGGHLEEEAVVALGNGMLDGVDGFFLIRTEEAEAIGLDEGWALGFVLPSSLGGVAGSLGQGDVIVIHGFPDELLRLGGHSLKSDDRSGRGEGRDDGGIPALEIPEIVDVPVGKDDEPAVESPGVAAGLFLANQGIFVLGLGLEHDQGKSLLVEHQEIDESLGSLLEVFPNLVKGLLGQGNARFQADVCRTVLVSKETPSCCFEQLVDLDAGGGFFHARGRNECMTCSVSNGIPATRFFSFRAVFHPLRVAPRADIERPMPGFLSRQDLEDRMQSKAYGRRSSEQMRSEE